MAAMRVGAAPEGRLPEPVLDRARKASLAAALGVEATSAWAASFAVSPLVFIVDKAIVSNASGRQRLFTCVKNELVGLITAPHLLLGNPGFRWIWTV